MLNHCTDYLKSKPESLTVYASMKERCDVFNLIKGITYMFEENKHHLQALHNSKILFFAL
jgi:hypothetical protein